MKKLPSLLFTVVFLGLQGTNVSASALNGASCTVTARVIGVGGNAPGNGKVENNPTYLKLEMLTAKRTGLVGDCGFVAIGNVFKIAGGTDLVSLNLLDTIEAGIEHTDSMGPAGVVRGIFWKPISLVNSQKSLPSSFFLNSGDTPEESTTSPNTKAPTVAQSLKGKTLLSVDFPLKPGHKLYSEYTAVIVPIGKLFDLNTLSGAVTQIKTDDELSRITTPFSTKEQALAFSQFFTSDETGVLLKPNPFSGFQASDPNHLYIKIPSSLSALLTSPTIKKVGKQWVVERDLFLNSYWVNKTQIPARLVRSHETISQTGTYRFGLKKVLAKGKNVDAFFHSLPGLE